MCASALVALAPVAAFALPQGGTVTGGAVVIQAPSPGQLGITQSSARAVIDWQSFDVGAGERVSIAQPSTSAILLNRIHDAKPSEIYGSLSANGTVLLANPNGMLFGPSSRLDVGGLIATSSRLDADAFLRRGQLLGTPGNPGASVIHRGQLTVRGGGLAALVAPGVENSGLIIATAGRVQLAGADTLAYDLHGDGLIQVAAGPQLAASYVGMPGAIEAHGGQVLLSAAQAAQLMSSAVNLDGLIEAGGLVETNGAVRLAGGVQMTAGRVTLGAASRIDVDGPQGGGAVQVGGGWQGSGPLPWAQSVEMKQGACIGASATDAGDGGEVVLWAKDRTQFDGRINARGGGRGGDGGRVETSGLEALRVAPSARVDASAPRGRGGLWLLDPTEITINAGTGVDTASNVYAANIQATLDTGTSVTIQTSGVDGDVVSSGAPSIAKTGGGDATLTLKAHGSINLTNTSIISGSNKLHTVLWSDSDNTSNGFIRLSNSTVTTNGGDFHAAGGLDDGADGGVAADGRPDGFAWGNVAFNKGVGLNNGDITAGAGNILLRGHGRNNAAQNFLYGVWINTGSQLSVTNGNLSLNGVAGNGGANNFGVYLENAGTLLTSGGSGNILISGTGGTTAGGGGNDGIRLANTVAITSTGTAVGSGAITLTGTSGTGTGSDNWGINGFFTGATISSHVGDITLTGTSLAAGQSSTGVGLNNTRIESLDSGVDAADITLTGTGGPGTGNNYGIAFFPNVQLLSVDGDLSLTGTGGNNANYGNTGIFMSAGAGSAALLRATGDGAITLRGYGDDGGSFGNAGIGLLAYSTLQTASGAIDVRGEGGDTSGPWSYGLELGNNSRLLSTDGNILVQGIGGNGGDTQRGIYIHDAGALVSSVNGDITITGQGGNGGGASNSGIELASGAGITSTGTGTGAGTITLNGTGGNGTDYNFGIYLTGTGTQVSSVDGDSAITGTGRGSGLNNHGVLIDSAAAVASTSAAAGAGDITITGIASSGTSDNMGIFIANGGSRVGTVGGDIALSAQSSGSVTNNQGLLLINTGIVETSGSGDISVTATAGAGGSDIRALIGSNRIGSGTMTGDITLNANTLDLANLSAQTRNNINVRPRTLSTMIGLAGAAGTLNLTAAELSMLLADVDDDGTGELAFGNFGQTGDVHINAYAGWTSDIRFATGTGRIHVDGAQTVGWTNALTLVTENDVVVNAAIDQAGGLHIVSNSAVGIGIAGGAGTINISDAELDLIETGWLGFGYTGAPAPINVGAYNNFRAAYLYLGSTPGTAIQGDLSPNAGWQMNMDVVGPVTLGGNIDISGATGNAYVHFYDAVTLNGNRTVRARSTGDIIFDSTVNGAHDLTLATAGVVTFGGAVGGVMPLGDITVTQADQVTGGTVRTASFTQAAGTGTTAFTNLEASGSIDITATGINGSYAGAAGQLDAGTGAVNATVRFGALDIDGASADLLPGYIGAPSAASQVMANLITVGGVSGPGTPTYRFAGFNIGAALPPAPSGGSTPPVTVPGITVPPVIIPPVTPPAGLPNIPTISQTVVNNSALLPATVLRATNLAASSVRLDSMASRLVSDPQGDYSLFIESNNYDTEYYGLSTEERPSTLPLPKDRLLKIN